MPITSNASVHLFKSRDKQDLEGAGGVRGGEALIRIYCGGKVYFQGKKKKKKTCKLGINDEEKPCGVWCS